MAKGRGPWQNGRQAWERLHGWHQDNDTSTAGHPDDGDRALDALGDVGLVRRLLDQAELGAVRTARKHGKSWAEIATRLGVTRQSAWERWRDLDEPGTQSAPAGEIALTVEPRAGQPAVPSEPERTREAHHRRRQSSLRVPDVVGMGWDDARAVLREAGLVGVGPDPDGPPLAVLGWPDGVVTDQSPEAGARVPPGSPVVLWVERGGGSGVREPRRPKPDPMTGRAVRDEFSDEAVS